MTWWLWYYAEIMKLNAVKVEKIDEVATPLEFAAAKEIEQRLGCTLGSIGPRGLDIPIIADHSALRVADFICGANRRAST